MRKGIKELLERCKTCKSGLCCQEGVELNQEEMKRIAEFNPEVKRPWFGLIDAEDEPDPGYTHETLVRDGRCIFQHKDKRCLVYEVRPAYCAEFPLEDGKLAKYYKRLCDNRPL